MTSPTKVHIKNIDSKIKFTEFRVAKLVNWEAPKYLSKIRVEGIAALNQQLTFLRKYKRKNKNYAVSKN